MFIAYLSPLAPAMALLLGAIVLSTIIPRLPARWQTHRVIQYFSAPGVVGLAGLLLLGLYLAPSTNGEALSAWNFSTESSGAGLTLRASELSLPFLILTILILLIVMLLTLPLASGRGRGWMLTLGASACVLFVSANELTLVYAILVFDALTAYYWLKRQHPHLAVARLFLGVCTASVLTLIANPAAVNPAGIFLGGLALWLRVGLYPFIEAIDEEQPVNRSIIVYAALSLAVGAYLVLKIMTKNLEQSGALFIIAIIIISAAGAAYFRTPFSHRLKISTDFLTQALLYLNQLLLWGEKLLSRTGKLILRVNVILEGQHYLGWAFFTALIGGLIILLQM